MPTLVCLVTTLSFGVAAVRCQADGGTSQTSVSNVVPGDIYLYQPNGQPPLDVTQTYLTYGYVFDADGNPLYIQFFKDQVHDLKGNTIGFIGS